MASAFLIWLHIWQGYQLKIATYQPIASEYQLKAIGYQRKIRIINQ
ncbi:hypothetical protein [Ornithinibacillus californiensis]|nr:hypothetical protein [Ornithinibacillus californiensis]